MLSLLALGKLSESKSFSNADVSPELINSIETYKMIDAEYKLKYYMMLLPALETTGRRDLASALRQVLESAAREVTPENRAAPVHDLE